MNKGLDERHFLCTINRKSTGIKPEVNLKYPSDAFRFTSVCLCRRRDLADNRTPKMKRISANQKRVIKINQVNIWGPSLSPISSVFDEGDGALPFSFVTGVTSFVTGCSLFISSILLSTSCFVAGSVTELSPAGGDGADMSPPGGDGSFSSNSLRCFTDRLWRYFIAFRQKSNCSPVLNSALRHCYDHYVIGT